MRRSLLVGAFSLLSLPALAQGRIAAGDRLGVNSPHVEPIPLAVPSASSLAARKTKYLLSVPARGQWVDAGIGVTPADHLAITATGSVTLADGRVSGPAGVARGWKDLLRAFPLESGNVGGLIGRIGDPQTAVPFPIGAALDKNAPASGELYLAANTGEQLAGRGKYTVHLGLRRVSAAAMALPSVNLEQMLPPDLFDGMPRQVADQQGDPGDMVNFAILGSPAAVLSAFAAAGWVQVDKTTNDAILHGLLATFSKKAYLSMPMSTLYLFGRPQDLSYARADPLMVALERHHLRVWNSGRIVAGRTLWVGSATHDEGLERDARNNGVTHRIDPHIDTERDFIEQTFAAAGVLDAAAYLTPTNPLRAARTATGGDFTSDGRIAVMLLRQAQK